MGPDMFRFEWLNQQGIPKLSLGHAGLESMFDNKLLIGIIIGADGGISMVIARMDLQVLAPRGMQDGDTHEVFRYESCQLHVGK